ncbi:GCD1 [Candida oxycetoniae]|uniref:Translation initiation factor eIF2B subunit gamma n=1 Tax=Candida oxycetoniae TaxID=497107 RepID=A0AAI9SZA7_9ASCO|nr:GCD1 [Candida oxycetoniae]KAI3405998.2 GCD1 [Candida oxycetoniae]
MDFTAIVFCGKGKALVPFSELRSTGVPKALLPVANKSILSYVLDWCQMAFFSKIIVVTSEESAELVQSEIDIYQSIMRKKSSGSSDTHDIAAAAGAGAGAGAGAASSPPSSSSAPSIIPIEVMPFTAEHNGKIIYNLCKNTSFRSKTRNFILLPCDFITNLPPQVLLEAFKNRDSGEVGITVSYKNQLDIEDKKSQIFPKNYTVYSNGNSGDLYLLDHYQKEDIDKSKMLQLRTQMCWRYPNSIISTKLLNSGIFLGSNEIFDIIEKEADRFTELYFQKREVGKVIRDLARRSWRHSQQKETIGIMIVPSEATFFRVNNLPVWMEANRHFMKQQAVQRSQAQHPKEKGVAQVGNDALVGENTQLGEKTSVKRSVIGSGCTIGKKVRVTGCLIMDNVVIEDDVQLDNCIIGHDVTIRSKSKLTNCNVESTNEIIANTVSKGDTLLCLSLENIEDVVEDSGEFALMSGSSTDDDTDGDNEEHSSGEESEYEDEFTNNDDGLFAY